MQCGLVCNKETVGSEKDSIMSRFRTICLLLLVPLLLVPVHAAGLNQGAKTEFNRIKGMTLGELGQAASRLIDAKYADVDWDAVSLPGYVFADLETEMSYKVAVIRPRLLGVTNVQDDKAVIPCYCTCDKFGHDNLLYCFFKDGDPAEEFDEHGAQCAVCIRQALLAFLWDDLGANHEDIMAGMKDKFAPLIEKYHSGS